LAASVAPHFGHFIVCVSFGRSLPTIISDARSPPRKEDNAITVNRTCPQSGYASIEHGNLASIQGDSIAFYLAK
jgi:hypothetical protein